MDVHEYEELSNFTTRQIKANEQCFNALLYGHRRVFNNDI